MQTVAAAGKMGPENCTLALAITTSDFVYSPAAEPFDSKSYQMNFYQRRRQAAS